VVSLRVVNIVLLPVSAGFALVLALRLASTPTRSTSCGKRPQSSFGAALGFALVLACRPRCLRGGSLFLVTAFIWLAAAIWIGGHDVVGALGSGCGLDGSRRTCPPC
jgi:hypothetical protein